MGENTFEQGDTISTIRDNPEGWPKNYWSDSIWEWVLGTLKLYTRREITIKIAKLIYLAIKMEELERDLLPQATILACIVGAQFAFEDSIPIDPILKCAEKIAVNVKSIIARLPGVKNNVTAPEKEMKRWQSLKLKREAGLDFNFLDSIIAIPDSLTDAKLSFTGQIMNLAKVGVFYMPGGNRPAENKYITEKMRDIIKDKSIPPEVRFIALCQSLFFSNTQPKEYLLLAGQLLEAISASNSDLLKDPIIGWFKSLILLQKYK